MSAAKLRTRGIAVIGATAIVMTSFGPAAFAAWDTANASQAGVAITNANQGTIGIVDTDENAIDNQGATLIEAGKTGQSIADVRLVIPNRFKAGDTIDLRLFDRSASEETNGNTNSGPSTLVGFSGVPTISVDGPQNDDTIVDADTDETDPQNTEAEKDNPWAAKNGETGVAAARPGVKPALSPQLVKSPANVGNDILRLTVTGDPSTGDPNGTWVVSLSDLKVDLGAAVTPGELRLVPFARNVQSNTTVADGWFYGNMDKLTAADSDPAVLDTRAREIGIYTVPAYVSPVTISTENQNIIADGNAQSVGKITIAETEAISLGSGNYRLDLSGATIANTSAANIKATLTGGGSNEQVSNVALVKDADGNAVAITFQLDNPDASKTSTITLDGVELKAAKSGQLQWKLSGGSVDEWLASPAGGGTTPNPNGISVAGQVVAPSQLAFTDTQGQTETVNVTGQQTATFNPTSPTVATPAPTAIGALGEGTYTVNNPSGNDWTITNAAGDVVATATSSAPTTFTPSTPFEGGNITFTNAPAAGGTFTVTGSDITTVTLATPGATPAAVLAGATQLGDGVYTLQAGTAPGTLRLADASGDAVSADFTPADAGDPTDTITLLALYAGTVTVTTDGTGVLAAGDSFTVTASTAGPGTLQRGTITAKVGGNVDDDTYTVAQTGNVFTLSNGTDTFTSNDGRTFTGVNGQITLSAAAIAGDTVTVATGAGSTVDAPRVNQDDILAPVDELTRTGSASPGSTAIGGTNRFGTAARIATQYVKSTGRPTADTAIVVNGMAAPDALSSSFLSQREGAPILLTAPGQLPSETVEALRDLGVRKVYIVGGRTAVGEKVFNALKEQNAYMWDDAAGAIKPRGDKLEVVQLGGDNRYETNWRVNTYAAAQTAAAAPVGQIATGYGEPMKTTAMVARSSASNDFVDALSASVLSAGRAGGLDEQRKAGTQNLATVSNGAFSLLNVGDADKIGTGTYRLVDLGTSAAPDRRILDAAGTQVGTWTPNNLVFTDAKIGTLPLSGVAANGNVFTVAANPNAGAVFGYDSTVAKVNALPTILTQPGKLVPQAASQMRALHIQHALLIGSDDALSKQVNDDIAAVGVTSYRIEGKDRWETAANVNRFAMAKETATKAGDVPGLGFDGSHVYSDANRTNQVGGQMTAYLANGLRFPDALVAGPWVSRTRNAMLMTLANEVPAPTAEFLGEKAAQLDNVAGLGQGDVVSSKVLAEANRIVSSK